MRRLSVLWSTVSGATQSRASSTAHHPGGDAGSSPHSYLLGYHEHLHQADYLKKANYPHIEKLTTRWHDNDVYGHINNVAYYGFFDTAVNNYLIRSGVLDIHKGEMIGFVVDSGCAYKKPLEYPNEIDVGIRIGKIGKSSVRYQLGVFRAHTGAGKLTPEDAEELNKAAAIGHFVHVYVDRVTRRPQTLTEPMLKALKHLVGKPLDGAAPKPSR